MSEETFDLAGFSDDNGDLGRAVPSGQILVPGEVRLNGDSIRWRLGKNARFQEVSATMLSQFIELDNPESILRFAKTWGVLALSGDKVLRPGRYRAKEGVEPVAAWQYYSRRARALLNVAAALKNNKVGDLDDWSEFARFVEGSPEEALEWARRSLESNASRFGLPLTVLMPGHSREERLARAREQIAKEIGFWFDFWKKGREDEGLSDFRLVWSNPLQRWDLQIDYHGLLFPAIALQLALVVANADSLYSCSSCGVPYIRPRSRRRPKTGWANYCDRCTEEGAAQRSAVATYREKRSQAVRMHLSGVPLAEISRVLKTDAIRVRSWLGKGQADAETKTRK
jgi:hypothetical protein